MRTQKVLAAPFNRDNAERARMKFVEMQRGRRDRSCHPRRAIRPVAPRSRSARAVPRSSSSSRTACRRSGCRRADRSWRPAMAGNDHDLDRWPAVAYRVGQLQPVHASRHLYVGEQQNDVVARFQNSHGLVGIVGLDGEEPGFLDDVGRVNTGRGSSSTMRTAGRCTSPALSSGVMP